MEMEGRGHRLPFKKKKESQRIHAIKPHFLRGLDIKENMFLSLILTFGCL